MRHSRKRGLITAMILFFVCAAPTFPQSGCGNVNCVGIVDLSDMSLAVNYITGGVSALGCPDVADMDGHYLYTLYDYCLLSDRLSHDYNHYGTCPPTLPALDPPVSSSDFVYYDNRWFPANQGSIVLSFGFVVSDTSDLFNFPLKVLVDGQPPVIDSVRATGPIPRFTSFDHPLCFMAQLRYSIPSDTFPAKHQALCRVYLSMAPDVNDRPITVSFDSTGPIQDAQKAGIPMIIRDWPGREVVSPVVQFCCQGERGNVNVQGIVDLADLSFLVSFLTGATTVLPCADEANVNAEGIVDLADLSSLVSYLTGGGYVLPPCG